MCPSACDASERSVPATRADRVDWEQGMIDALLMWYACV
jgi:hypothetical protein